MPGSTAFSSATALPYKYNAHTCAWLSVEWLRIRRSTKADLLTIPLGSRGNQTEIQSAGG